MIEFVWHKEYDWLLCIKAVILACFLKHKMYLVSSNQGQLRISYLEKASITHNLLERTEVEFLVVNGISLCIRKKVWISDFHSIEGLNVVTEKLAIMQYGFRSPILRLVGIRNDRWNFGQQGMESFCGGIRILSNSLLKRLWSLSLRSREGRSSSSPQLLTLGSFF